MLHLLAASAFAAMGTATLDAPAPMVADLDLLPEPGAGWPCNVTLQADGMGAITDVKVARGCPSGLVDTTIALGRGWHFEPASAPHAEEVTITYRVLRADEAEPKPETTADKLVYLIRPLDLLPAPSGAGVLPPPPADNPASPYSLDKPMKPKMPAGAEAARVRAGTCLVRVTVGPDGKVTSARANRCLDLLAPTAVATVKKLKFTVAEGTTTPGEFDLPVRFTAAKD